MAFPTHTPPPPPPLGAIVVKGSRGSFRVSESPRGDWVWWPRYGGIPEYCFDAALCQRSGQDAPYAYGMRIPGVDCEPTGLLGPEP